MKKFKLKMAVLLIAYLLIMWQLVGGCIPHPIVDKWLVTDVRNGYFTAIHGKYKATFKNLSNVEKGELVDVTTGVPK